jgi:transcriptional regulator with XRE-family HTH domain
MPEQIKLSEDDRANLKRIIDAVGLTQTKLAQVAGFKQSWLSLILSGERRNVDGEMLERVATQLAERLKNLSPDSTLPGKDVNAAFIFLSRFTKTAATIMQPKFYRPGGPVPIDSAHYIERSQDNREVLDALTELPFTMQVTGPVQCGKSSLLARLEHKAIELGIETARFDPQLTVSSLLQKNRRASDVNATVAKALSELLQAQWGLERPHDDDFDSIPRLLLWLKRALRPTASKLKLLIIDDIASLGRQGAEDWCSLFVRAMDKSISMAVGMTNHFGVNFARRVLLMSTVVRWLPKVEVDWLNEKDVEKLVQLLAEDSSRVPGQHENANPLEVYELFQGQPYLTHASTVDHGFRKAVKQWNSSSGEEDARPIRGAPWYKEHLKAVRVAILGPTLEADNETRKLLESFGKICSGEVSPDELHSDHVLFLDTARLIKSEDLSGKKTLAPRLKIYRLIAEDLAEFIRN